MGRGEKEIQKMGLHKDFYKAFKTKANLEGKTMKDLSQEMAEDLKKDVQRELENIGVQDEDGDSRRDNGVSFL